MTKKEIMDEVYNSLLVTAGLVGLSMASKKLLNVKLTGASDMKDISLLIVGITSSTLLIKYAQDKKWLPEDPL